MKVKSRYPTWICGDCGAKHGRWPTGHLATFHEPDPADPNDCCGWCGTRSVALTEPRDYGYPPMVMRA